jgi:Ca-activated chloride channel homolog
LLHKLSPSDRFALVLFNSEVQVLAVQPATPGNIAHAIDLVRGSRLRGGTNLQKALEAGLQQALLQDAKNCYLVILSDGGATQGPILNSKLASSYAASWAKVPEVQRPHTYIFAVGDDANLPLFKLLARQNGLMEHVLSTEPLEFKLNSFLSRLGHSPMSEVRATAAPSGAVEDVYPLQDSIFAGSIASWVGRYSVPRDNVRINAHAMRDESPVGLEAVASFPKEALDHPQLPRLWARARVDALLEKIDREGEDAASIDEIIRLARQYKFVTPYTSFLAVPRSLLRPRVIRPGDPVFRVRTDESIVSVVALFPFGLVQHLRHLPAEDIWQTRFLAPTDMQDGTYTVRLILRDRSGNTYREQKTFVIASQPPLVRVRLDRNRFQRGEVISLRVSASERTRTLVARMDGSPPIELHWDRRIGASTGTLVVPEQAIPGKYVLTVTAEDIAHNVGTREVPIEVLP